MKREPQLPLIEASDLTRADALLRRMLDAPPKPHEEMTLKAQKKRAKKPRK